ncbi:DUF1405 domain-containing protein [Halorientalis brevis]|uniref:DUF1405 domain-containing protein n=1 Tax=Halorientalis brevis TaxID=1126241 RepID=A0ABD6C7G4_9EURY|nr:DUF1405 domain-containing protein [Halorientalis brevis]
MSVTDAGRRLEQFIARYFDGRLPDREPLPRYVAPLPAWLEDAALRLAWPIAIVNLLGTAFGFWYYGFQPIPLDTPLIAGQFAVEPLVAWPVVPDSPVATMFIGLSLVAWKLDLDLELLHVLAFFGCIKLGLWTPYVQLYVNGLGDTPLWLYHFLVWSHFAMAVEAFIIYRYSAFPIWAIAVATGWYLFNDVVDYFIPLVGEPHHTLLPAEIAAGFNHDLAVHDQAAAGAVVLTVLAVFLAMATRATKAELGH